MNHKSNPQNKITIVILGRSGSGKGTQAEFILHNLSKEGASHLETGKFFRRLSARNGNSTIDLVRKTMAKGEFLPYWFPVNIWFGEILQKNLAKKHWLFDGAPRHIKEAQIMDEVTSWHGRPLPLCLYVDVTEKEATRRLLNRGRDDDTKNSVKNRMKSFAKRVLPVVKYYKNRNRLIKINGNQKIEEVWKEIDSALAKRLNSLWP